MIWFNEEKGLGFISTEEGERLHVGADAFAPGAAPVGRCAGVVVEFNVVEADGERTAGDVVLVEEAAPRRARRRQGHR
jgi:cold shock CspA family protein